MKNNLKSLDSLWLYFAPLVVIFIAADQLTKLWAFKTAPETAQKIGFELAYNYGILFGMDLPLWGIYLLTGGVLALGAYLVLENKLWQDEKHLLALSLIFSGALGNLIDRLAHGFVIDFIKIYWWPNFNLADTFIVLGVGLFLWIFLIEEKVAVKL